MINKKKVLSVYLYLVSTKTIQNIKMIKVFLLILVILLPAILLMGYRVFFTKKGKFPSIHVDSNPEMRKRGIKCVRSQDLEAQKKEKFIKK